MLRSTLRGYAMAVFGAALLLLLDQVIPSADVRNSVLAVTFVLSVVLASALGGWRPGVLATLLGLLVHVFVFLEPRYQFKLLEQREVLRIIAYCITGAAITCLSEALLRAWDRARDRQRQLELVNRRQTEFLATLAHELRNPLAPLRTGVQLLQLARHDETTVRETLAMMERQLGHTARLVDDLLDVSRISRGTVELRRHVIPLKDVIDHAIETSRSVIDAAGHQLTTHLPAAPIYVDGDLTRLAQVVSNLLNNAAKYTDRGGRIELCVEQQANRAIIRVRDNGIGIPREMLPHVFEMFAQIDRSTPRAQGGLGIGLSLARLLMELHGGSMAAHSDGPGRGAEFTVQLPTVPAPATVASRTQAPTKSMARLRILVVDDNRDNARSLAMLLEVLGNEVTVANDGLSAVDAAQTNRPALMLLDLGLPGIDGYEVCRRIRTEDWGHGIVIVAITGWGQDEDRLRTRAAGFDEHLVKPVAPGAISDLVARLANAPPSPR